MSVYKEKEELISKYKHEAELQGLEFIARVSNGVGLYRGKDCGHEFQYQITAVRQLYSIGAKPRCPVCMEEHKSKCMEHAGVVEVESLKGGRYLFKRLTCGHTFISSHAQLLKVSEESCSHCRTERIYKEAAAVGLQVVGRSGNIYEYKLPCGHTKAISPRLVRTGGWRCKDCYEDSVKESARKYGYEYIGESDKGPHYRLCKIIACGHLKDVQVHDITNRPRVGVCTICAEEKHKQEALDADLILIGKASNGNANYRRYRTSCCNTDHDFMVTHVRRNSYTCPSCGNSHLDSPSNIYLFEMTHDSLSWLKLGFSSCIERRLSEYGLSQDVEVLLIHSKVVSSGREAVKIEKSLHKKYKQFKLCSNKMRAFFSVSGFNECYPATLKNELLLELENIKELNNG